MKDFESLTLTENESKIEEEMEMPIENQPEERSHQESHDPVSDSDQEHKSETYLESEEIKTQPVEENVSLDQDSKKERKNSAHYDTFLKEYEKIEGVEAKLQFTIDFMESSLCQQGSPHFKSFWEARNICLKLFRENISQNVRLVMWNKYTELSKEARRLKEILDEQSSFAAEQIEMAILAIENDLEKFEENLEKIPPVDFGFPAKSLAQKYPAYGTIQRELNLLNTQASRVNGLRKELIRTEMRIKIKNRFFQRLSLIGDKIFPRRKELIKHLSDQFLEDVNLFIEDHFKKNTIEDALFFLREEIKALQGLAKLLTLNTHSFTETRRRLSDCWDQLKNVEKERKKERASQKIQYKENVDSVLEKLHLFNQTFSEGQLSIEAAENNLDEIASFMRSVQLGRDEVRFLREQFNEARKPIFEALKAEEEKRAALELERDLEKKRKAELLRNEVRELLENSSSLDVEAIIAAQSELFEKVAESKLSKLEKNELEKKLKSLKDLISDKKEEALMSLSEDDKQALVQLTTVLSQRKERRLEIKFQLDQMRKANGTSGFDFEQAMKNNELIEEEKERLAKIDLGIKEIESLISELKKKAL